MRDILIATALLLASPAQAASWKAKERIVHYSIAGSDPLALYKSIGKSGPMLKGGRAIAHTTWDLKWRRDYQPTRNAANSGCALVSALPFLTITYTLPKPSKKLSGDTKRRWQTFYDGILKHEKIHGDIIRQMTKTIITRTVGQSTVTDTKGCKKLRANILKTVQQTVNEATKQHRQFDRTEFGKDGAVRTSIVELVSPRS